MLPAIAISPLSIGGGTLQLTSAINTGKTVFLVGASDGNIDTTGFNSTFSGSINALNPGVTLSKVGRRPADADAAPTIPCSGGTNLTDGALRISNGNAIGSGHLTTTGGTTFTAGMTNNSAVMHARQ